MGTTNNRRDNLSWSDQDKVNEQLKAIRELAKELRTDYPTDTADAPTNWSNEARNRRNALIRAQFTVDENGEALHLLNGFEWLELFDMLGFSVDKETRKRFASLLNWYSFWYADFKPRLSSKYAQHIHWYVQNFLFCLRNKLQTEKDYRDGKFGSTGQAYFTAIEQQPATPSETPQISMETAERINVSGEGDNARESRVMQSRDEVIAYLDKTHGIEYDAGEVVYLKDGYVAEEHSDKSEWRVYRDEDSDKCVETLRIAPQSPETPQTADCAAKPCKLAQTA